MTDKAYIGRFAPTPSGPLHFGSIIAALGSYLQAKQNHGQWLVRIEDVDTPRARPGAASQILDQLQDLQLYWDGEILYQSKRNERYREHLNRLINTNQIYACECTRKQVSKGPYPGMCKDKQLPLTGKYALRIRVNDEYIQFNDVLQGPCNSQLEAESGDFIVRRSDGLFAYHLAVVIDDDDQNVTEIVRGADLLDSTSAQIYLQHCLGLHTPSYLHLPVAVDKAGKKLSKRDQAVSISQQPAERILIKVLEFLGQSLPDAIDYANSEEIIKWAIKHWDTEKIPAEKSITVSAV